MLFLTAFPAERSRAWQRARSQLFERLSASKPRTGSSSSRSDFPSASSACDQVQVVRAQRCGSLQVLKRHLKKREGFVPGAVVLVGGKHPSTREIFALAKKASCPVKLLACKSPQAARQAGEAGVPLLHWHTWLHLQVLLKIQASSLGPDTCLDSGQQIGSC